MGIEELVKENEELKQTNINLLAKNERLHTQCDIVEDRERRRVHEWYHGKLRALHEWARKQPKEISDPIFGCLANGSPSVFESSIYTLKMNSLKFALEIAEKELMKTKQTLAEAKREGVRGFLEKIVSYRCPVNDCAYCSEDILCDLRNVVKQNDIETIIKKVEGI